VEGRGREDGREWKEGGRREGSREGCVAEARGEGRGAKRYGWRGGEVVDVAVGCGCEVTASWGEVNCTG
jgi:hypothetical protein